MNDTQKSFSCTIAGCDMTFTNEDHLNCHHKKHDMVLNIGLTEKNIEAADQTPTPTRFIRNCEEVGLFQDLQNVNPFDETFKKAIECVKAGTLHVPISENNDDTLHTPHIFPHVENNVSKYINTPSENHSAHSNDFCINSVPSIESQCNDEPHENYDLTIVSDDETDDCEREKDKSGHLNLKNKLKETIMNKEKGVIQSVVITPVPLKKLQPSDNINTKQKVTKENNENIKRHNMNSNVDDPKEKIRAMNRVAQLRCRKRKKMQWKKMEEDLKLVKAENSKLLQENQHLKHKIYALKEMLLSHKSISGHNNLSFLSDIEKILNSPEQLARKEKTRNILPANKNKNKLPITPPAVPVPIIPNFGQTNQNPVLIQVMGPVTQLALSVLPNK